MMDDSVVAKLRYIVGTYGLDVCNNPRQVEGLLRDLSGEHRREISVLTGATREGVPAELLAARESIAYAVLVERLTRLLQDNLALTDEAARWAVETWALALGVARTSSQSSARPAQPVSRVAPHAVSVTSQGPASGQAKHGSSRAAEALYRIAKDPDNDLSVRMETAEKLAKLDPRRAADIFYSIATDENNEFDERLDAADTLARIDRNRAADVFYSIATDENNDLDYRLDAADRLAGIDTERAAGIDDLL
jgi:hypothetical protein